MTLETGVKPHNEPGWLSSENSSENNRKRLVKGQSHNYYVVVSVFLHRPVRYMFCFIGLCFVACFRVIEFQGVRQVQRVSYETHCEVKWLHICPIRIEVKHPLTANILGVVFVLFELQRVPSDGNADNIMRWSFAAVTIQFSSLSQGIIFISIPCTQGLHWVFALCCLPLDNNKYKHI